MTRGLSGHLRDMGNIAVDFLGSLTLLARGTRDLGHHFANAPGHFDDPIERFAGTLSFGHTNRHLRALPLHRLDGLTSCPLNFVDHPRDFLGCSRSPFGEAANFAGDNRKAPPLLARPRSFDCGIQGQQVGLPGNLRDDGGNGPNLV